MINNSSPLPSPQRRGGIKKEKIKVKVE